MEALEEGKRRSLSDSLRLPRLDQPTETKDDTKVSQTEETRQNHVEHVEEEDVYAHNLSRYEQISHFITQLTDKRNELETKIEEQLTLIARTSDKEHIANLSTQLQTLESDLLETETDILTKSIALTKLKQSWRLNLVQSMLEDAPQTKKIMVDLLRVSSKEVMNPLVASSSSSHIGHRRQNSTSKSTAPPNSLRNSKRFSISADNLKEAMGEINKWDISSKNLMIEYDKVLGKGNFGIVYKGKLLGKEVAIKKLSEQEWNDEVMSEFIKEVTVMWSLRHPNILLFIGACTEPLCIVTEIMPRGSVWDLLHKKNSPKLPIKRKFMFAKEAAQGMNYLHRMQPAFLHLDLKTANLLVDENFVVKLADFGLSRMKKEQHDGRLGSPMYSSPELLLGKAPTTKSDVYSFGVILWELFTEEIPYDNRFESLDELCEAITLDGERPPLTESMPPLLKKLITSCFSADPNQRPSFQEMLKNNIFEKIIFEGIISPVNDFGRKIWEEKFFGQWIVPWKEFSLEFCKSLGITWDSTDIKLLCLKQVLFADTEDEIVSIENYAQMLEWVGPLEKGFLDRLYELLSKNYFYGNISLYAAEKSLNRKLKKGTFLIRFSSSEAGAFTLSWVTSELRTQHLRIAHQPSKGYSLEGLEFATLDELVMSKKLRTLKPPVKLKHPCQPTPFSLTLEAWKNKIFQVHNTSSPITRRAYSKQ